MRNLGRYSAALGWVALSTLIAEALFRLTGNTRLSMVFLAAVLLSAFFQGSGPAYVAALAAFFVYNFYLVEPRFSLSIDAEDMLNLVVFLAVAMLTGSLTGRVRDQAARAEARARTTDALYRATRELSALSDESTIRQKLAEHLALAARGEAFVRDGLRTISAREVALDPALLRELASLEREPFAAVKSSPCGAWTLRPLRAAGASLGVAAWRRGGDAARQEDGERLLEILADAGAATLARARLAAAKAEAEARARTEDLRNALLASISHDLRTPLAAIMASASSLQEFGETFDPVTRRDLALTIQEETERLDTAVANLLSMSRLEAGAISIEWSGFNVPEVVERAVERRSGWMGRTAQVSLQSNLPEALGDAVLFEQALGNVLENAFRHTPAASPVEVAAFSERGEVVVDVRDAGAGLPPHELERVFEKFFRGRRALQTTGTGLGLSITRGLMQAMGGSVTARNNSKPAIGLTVQLRLRAAAT
jgi:two-component system, OmpR family, sensor histidine kinase KdpD